jgi:hypothetical protein
VQAVRLRRAAAKGDASARLAAVREFVEFFRNEERVYLRMRRKSSSRLSSGTSSGSLLPSARCASNTCSSRFARTLEVAVAAGGADRETLDAAGDLLDAHSRLEERQLFPLIEELVPSDELRRLRVCVVSRVPVKDRAD